MKPTGYLIYGIAINDAEYAVSPEIDGKTVYCPFYRAWSNMLKRCYNHKYQKKQPTYIGCSVCDEWLKFSAFRKWMETQDWKNKELDKDILNPGNKVYSPENCMFVSRAINSLLHVRSRRNQLPQGVWFDLGAGKFRAEFTANGKKKYIGLYRNALEAWAAYRNAKAAHIRSVAVQQDERLSAALMRHADALVC